MTVLTTKDIKNADWCQCGGMLIDHERMLETAEALESLEATCKSNDQLLEELETDRERMRFTILMLATHGMVVESADGTDNGRIEAALALGDIAAKVEEEPDDDEPRH